MPKQRHPDLSQVLAIPRETAARYSERIQELLGYSIHPPFMGYGDGMHPRRLIDPADESSR